MFFGVAIPAIVVGIIAWFYLVDKPADAKWLTPEEQIWLTEAIAAEREGSPRSPRSTSSVRYAFSSGRVWMLSVHLLRLHLRPLRARLLPADDHRGLRGAVRHQVRRRREGPDHGDPVPARRPRPLLLVARRHPRGVRTWHIALPALARRREHPARPVRRLAGRDDRGHHRDRLAIFAALPNFWTAAHAVPHRRRRRCRHRPDQHDRQPRRLRAPLRHRAALKDLTGGYEVPMFVVGGLMLALRRSSWSCSPRTDEAAQPPTSGRRRHCAAAAPDATTPLSRQEAPP